MESPLPSRGTTNHPKELLMYHILDEVYGTPEVEDFSYFVYRINLCLRRHEEMPIPSQEVDMMKEVLSCQQQFGTDEGNALVVCIALAVDDAANKSDES